MSAGQPNWLKLQEMGKLPKEARGRIPLLAQLDKAEERLEEIKKGCCDACREKLFPDAKKPEQKKDEKDPADVTVKCEVDGCDFVAKGKSEAIAKNNLRLHSRSHESAK